jgi:hypothetical protein
MLSMLCDEELSWPLLGFDGLHSLSLLWLLVVGTSSKSWLLEICFDNNESAVEELFDSFGNSSPLVSSIIMQ